MEKTSKIYVAGHKGLVGSAIFRNLRAKGYKNLITRTRQELDLRDTAEVRKFFDSEKPEYVFLAAAKVGGIVANNTYRADFLYENLMIQTNVIHQSYLHGVKKLMFLGSTCIYPKDGPQPIKEEDLLTGPLEYTNEPYAIAKIAGFKMCESYNLQYGTNFIPVMPTNLYGPNDNFDLVKSHVLPALVRKLFLGKALEEGNWEAIAEDLEKRPIGGIAATASREEILRVLDEHGVKTSGDPTGEENRLSVRIEIWGSGRPKREFLWSEDLADACIFLMERVDFNDMVDQRSREAKEKEVRNTHVNIGTGKEISIEALAQLVKETLGFKGSLFFNTSKADGAMRKLTDISRLQELGWQHKVELKDGVSRLYQELLREKKAALDHEKTSRPVFQE